MGGRARDLFPLTGLGLLSVGAASGGLFFLAFPRLDQVLLVVAFALLALVGLAVVSVIGVAIWARLGLRSGSSLSVNRLETSIMRPTGFSLPSPWWFPLVQLDWSWSAPEQVVVQLRSAHGRLFEDVLIQGRRHIRDVRRRFVVRDTFGLASVAFVRGATADLTVLPHAGALKRFQLTASFAAGDELPHPMGLEDGDRVELRRYVPGDPARFIHWEGFRKDTQTGDEST